MIDLQKSAQTAGIQLKKSGVDTARLPTMRVGLMLDVSGSMRNEYDDGHVQNATTHLLGLALQIDGSKQMDVFTFTNDAGQCRYPISQANYTSYVRQHIMDDRSISKWGGTSYAPPIHLAYQHYYPDLTHLHSSYEARRYVENRRNSKPGFFSRLFGRSTATAGDTVQDYDIADARKYSPTLMLFLTDGHPDDAEEARTAVHAAIGLPIFWAFVGLDHDSRFLRELATEADAEFVNLENVRIDDEQLFRSLLSPKLSKWLRGFHT